MGADNKPSETPLTNAIVWDIEREGVKLLTDPKLTRDDYSNFAQSTVKRMTEHARQLERSNVALREALERALRENIRWLSANERAFGDEPEWATQARAALQGGK